MATTFDFLASLSEYPQGYQIAEASDYAQDKATEYAQSLDKDAAVEVNEGEVTVKWDIEDEEFAANVQTTFDEAFGEKIFEMGFRE